MTNGLRTGKSVALTRWIDWRGCPPRWCTWRNCLTWSRCLWKHRHCNAGFLRVVSSPAMQHERGPGGKDSFRSFHLSPWSSSPSSARMARPARRLTQDGLSSVRRGRGYSIQPTDCRGLQKRKQPLWTHKPRAPRTGQWTALSRERNRTRTAGRSDPSDCRLPRRTSLDSRQPPTWRGDIRPCPAPNPPARARR